MPIISNSPLSPNGAWSFFSAGTSARSRSSYESTSSFTLPASWGYAAVSISSSQTTSTTAQSEHEAMRQSMSLWHELGHFPAFSAFSFSSVQSESSLPQTCVDVES